MLPKTNIVFGNIAVKMLSNLVRLCFAFLLGILLPGCVWTVSGIGSMRFYADREHQKPYFEYHKTSGVFIWLVVLPPVLFAEVERGMISLASDDSEIIRQATVGALINPLSVTILYESSPEEEATHFLRKYKKSEDLRVSYQNYVYEYCEPYWVDQGSVMLQKKEAFWGIFENTRYCTPKGGTTLVTMRKRVSNDDVVAPLILFSNDDLLIVKNNEE